MADSAVGKSEGDRIGKEWLIGRPHSPVKGRLKRIGAVKLGRGRAGLGRWV
jgi:hypothetical protein